MGDFHRSVEIAIFTDEFPPTLPNHLPSQRLSHMSFAMFRAMGDFHRSVEIARFLPMSASPKSPNNLPSQRPSRISFAMFSAMGDFHRSVEIARFLPMSVPPNSQNIPITKTITDVFCNVQSNGRFSPIGGNRAIFTDEIPQIAKSFPIPETFLKCSKQWGDFHRLVEIVRYLPMKFPLTLPNHLPSQRPSHMSSAMFRAMGNFHRSVESEPFLPMNFPQIAKQFAIPKTVTDFFWVPKFHGQKKSHRNRDRFATESPATCQIWRDGWQPSLLGPGGWGRPTLPRGTSPFCVCTSSAQCSDSFLEDRNLPK